MIKFEDDVDVVVSVVALNRNPQQKLPYFSWIAIYVQSCQLRRNVCRYLLSEVLPDALQYLRVGLLPCSALPFIEVFRIDAEEEVADKLYVLDCLEGSDAFFEDMRGPLENALLLFHYNQKMLQSE